MIVPGSIVTAVGLNPRYFAKINEKLLSTPPDRATTASVFSDFFGKFKFVFLGQVISVAFHMDAVYF